MTLDEAKRWFPHMAAALDQPSPLSFALLMEAYYFQQQSRTADAQAREAYGLLYPELLKRFEKDHGGIEALFCATIPVAAAVITHAGDIYTVLNVSASQARFSALANDMDQLTYEVRRLTAGSDRQTCSEMIYGWYGNLMEALDVQRLTPAAGRAVIAHFVREKARIESYYRRAAERNAHFQYFIGMAGGIIGLAFFVVLSTLALAGLTALGLDVGLLLASVIAGGAGAVVSVMTRVTSGRLLLNFEAGTGMLLLLGLFRPLLGAVFGAAIFVLVVAGLLPLSVPEPSKQLYFFAGLGFIAGFSERWAQDMISTTADRAGVLTRPDGQPQTKQA